MSSSLFAKENLIKSNFVQWKEVGQTVCGVYVDKKVVPNRLKPGTNQTLYTLVQDSGLAIIVAGRGNQDPSVIPGLENLKFGEYVGLKYEGDIESKSPGMNPAKIIRCYSAHEVQPEILESWQRRGAVFTDENEVSGDLPPI